MVRQFVYTSRLTGDAEERRVSLAAIREASERNNPRAGISGALFVSGSLAIQFLEGPPAQVERLMALLRTDRRHRGLTVLHDAPAPAASLPEWDMATQDVSAFPQTCADIEALTESYRKTFRFALPDLLTIVQAHLQLVP